MKINSKLSYYERLISNELKYDIDDGFDAYTAQWWDSPNYDFMDFSESGEIFKSYMKMLSRKQSRELGQILIEEYQIAINKDYFVKQCEEKIQKTLLELKEKYTIHPCFSADLIEVYDNFKHNYLITSNENKVTTKTQNTSTRKIKWLGKINVLTTLFYDLLHGQDKERPLIESSLDDIEALILNNFLDADGKELSKDTIHTILRSDKYDKRAKKGDRIEIGNVKPKV